MVAELPEIAGLRPRCSPRFLERIVEVEALHVLALLACFERAEQILHLVITEAAEREVDVRYRLQVSEEPGEEGVVPGARDLVQGEPEESSLLDGDIEPGHGHAREPEPAGGDETLVAADDGPILASREHRLDEAELPEAPLEGVELVLADPARVRRVWSEVVDQNVVDSEGRERGRCGHAVRVLRVLSTMRTSVL